MGKTKKRIERIEQTGWCDRKKQVEINENPKSRMNATNKTDLCASGSAGSVIQGTSSSCCNFPNNVFSRRQTRCCDNNSWGGAATQQPSNNPTKKATFVDETESMIAKDLYNLSLKERDDVFYDIHGVRDLQEETTELRTRACQQLETMIITGANNNSTNASVLNQVFLQSPDYVRSLYLKFLRCDGFDRIEDSYQRMIRYCDVKLELFGPSKLSKDITLKDMSMSDVKTLEKGFYQLLGTRDRAGRAIFCKIWYHQFYDVEKANVWRIFWYMMECAIADVETQKKGVVAVLYNVFETWIHNMDLELYMGVTKVRSGFPIRFVAAHYVYSDPAFGAVMKVITETIERGDRCRTKLHQGSHVEVQYKLLSYGIPVDALPVNSEGLINRKLHTKFIKMRRMQEEHQEQERLLILQAQQHAMMINMNPMALANQLPKPTTVIVVPSHADVLFGKGKPVQLHIGNIRFANLIEEQMERYNTVMRNMKPTVINEIIQTIQQQDKGRFLRRDEQKGGMWIEVTPDVAADKVGHAFRNRKPTKFTLATTSSTKKPQKKRVDRPTQAQQKPTSALLISPTSVITDVSDNGSTTTANTANASSRSRYGTESDNGGITSESEDESVTSYRTMTNKRFKSFPSPQNKNNHGKDNLVPSTILEDVVLGVEKEAGEDDDELNELFTMKPEEKIENYNLGDDPLSSLMGNFPKENGLGEVDKHVFS